MPDPHTVEAPGRLYRVARADGPLRFAQIDPADVPLPNAGNRFDVPGGGVLYCATMSTGCYAETLSRFRPSAAVRAAVQAEDPHFMVCGGVPADWRNRRLKVTVTVVDPLPFLDVEDERTHEALTTELAKELSALSVPAVDVSVIRGPNRLVTRAVAAWAYSAIDQQGNYAYGGIRYMSRLGKHECWAVFDGTDVREVARDTIHRDDPDLHHVASGWDLKIF